MTVDDELIAAAEQLRALADAPPPPIKDAAAERRDADDKAWRERKKNTAMREQLDIMATQGPVRWDVAYGEKIIEPLQFTKLREFIPELRVACEHDMMRNKTQIRFSKGERHVMISVDPDHMRTRKDAELFALEMGHAFHKLQLNPHEAEQMTLMTISELSKEKRRG